MSSIFSIRSVATGLLLAFAGAGVLAAPNSPDPVGREHALAYRSAFENYRAWDERSVASWSDLNRTVLQIGGWRAYAKEAQQPDSATPDVNPHANQKGHAGHGAQP